MGQRSSIAGGATVEVVGGRDQHLGNKGLSLHACTSLLDHRSYLLGNSVSLS